MIPRFTTITKLIILLFISYSPLLGDTTPAVPKGRMDIALATKPEMVFELIATTSQIATTITQLALQGAAQGGKGTLSAEQITLVSNLTAAFNYFVQVLSQIQQDYLIRDPQTGNVLSVTAKDGTKIPAQSYQLKLECLKGKTLKNAKGEDMCKLLACDTKQQCMGALFRDLVGYSTYEDGKKIKHKGIISEVIKVVFTGYKIGDKKYPSIFDTIATLAKMPDETKKTIINAMKSAKRILKLVASLNYKAPAASSSAKKEPEQKTSK